MKNPARRKFLAGSLAVATPSFSFSQDNFPAKQIRVIIGFPPGSALDPDARLITKEMALRFGQPVVIEHRPGARGTIGARLVASSQPDGHTLYYGNAISIHPIFNKNNSIDAAVDFSAVSASTRVKYYVIARSGLPVRTLKDLIDYGKAHPGELKHGAPSQTFDLMMRMVTEGSGINTLSIPYRASPEMIIALLAGDIDIAAGPVQTYISHIKSGTLRGLFIADRKRSAILPEVQTSSEFGLSGFEVGATNGFWAPAGTPRSIIQKLSIAISGAVANPLINEQILKGSGDEPLGTTPEMQLQLFQSDSKFWAMAAQKSNFNPD